MKTRITFFVLALLALVLLAAPVSAGRKLVTTITRVSVASDGTQANGASGYFQFSTISADGRYVAFDSIASNLVPDDTNGIYYPDAGFDVFVHDRETGITERVSVTSYGGQANSQSQSAFISADGRYVAFTSWATNLVPGDTNSWWDAFVHDRQTGVTERVSVAADGTQGNWNSVAHAISADGRFVTFDGVASNLVPGDMNGTNDVFLRDRQMGTLELVSVASDGSQGNSTSLDSDLSADGRYVAFASLSSNLVPDDTNGTWDVFVRDRRTGTTERVSVSSDGTEARDRSGFPRLSADGRYVSFQSYAPSLVAGDTNNAPDIFVHDRKTGVTERVSVTSDGTQGNGSCGWYHSISGDGRYVAFDSTASNLAAGDTNGTQDVFVHDRLLGTTELISADADGTAADAGSYRPTISSNARHVSFTSWVTNFVPGDTNGVRDVFVRDRGGASHWDPNGGRSP